MHYYQFNIGDYASHTCRLSIYEDIAYRRLLDLYYLNERPLNGCSTDVAREIGMLDSLVDVEYILNKFFIKIGDEWVNKRCDTEIKAYQDKRQLASKAGKASAEARKNKEIEQTFNGRSTDVQPTINHKPITNNHKNKNKNLAFSKPCVQEIKDLIIEKKYIVDAEVFFNYYESNGWKVSKNPMKNWKATLANWNSREVKNETNKRISKQGKFDPSQYILDGIKEDIETGVWENAGDFRK